MKVTWLSSGQYRSGFIVAVRLGLGFAFLHSSLPKIRLPYKFLSDVYNYELVGPKLGVWVALALPWLEFTVGACLIGGIFLGAALLTGAVMGMVFTFSVAAALYRGLDISCGCFSAPQSVGYATLIRASAIFLFSMTASVVEISANRQSGQILIERADPVPAMS